MSLQLKIKSKHLAAEARIIKSEEFKIKRRANPRKYVMAGYVKPNSESTEEEREAYKKLKWERLAKARATKWTERQTQLYVSLNSHRRGELRDAARLTHLARMFIKGTPYAAVEQRYKTLDRGTAFAREAKNIPNVTEIARMVKEYGDHKLPDQVRNLDKDEKTKAVIEIVKEWTGKF